MISDIEREYKAMQVILERREKGGGGVVEIIMQYMFDPVSFVRLMFEMLPFFFLARLTSFNIGAVFWFQPNR